MRDTDDYDELRGKPIMVFSDPVERFESCINAYLVEKQRYYHYGEDMFASFGVDLKTCTKQEKIDYFFANFNKLSSHHQLHHELPVHLTDEHRLWHWNVSEILAIRQYDRDGHG